MAEEAQLALIIFLFSLVQSIFGVGLLVFGTPTLLLMGFSFETTLSLLLPCSLAISLCQLAHGYRELNRFKFEFIKLALIPMAMMLVITLLFQTNFNLKFFIGAILILSALIRGSASVALIFQKALIKHSKEFLVAIGLVHGATNMGGGLLTIFASTICEGKNATRAYISYGYALMATIQLSVLALANQLSVGVLNIFLVLIALVTFLVVGNKLFLFANSKLYHQLMTILMLAFGITLIV